MVRTVYFHCTQCGLDPCSGNQTPMSCVSWPKKKKKKYTKNTKKQGGRRFSIFLHFTHSEGFSTELVMEGQEEQIMLRSRRLSYSCQRLLPVHIWEAHLVLLLWRFTVGWGNTGTFLSPHNLNKNMYADLSLSYHTSLYQWRDLLR